MSRLVTLRESAARADREYEALLTKNERILSQRSLTAAEVSAADQAKARLSDLASQLEDEEARTAEASAELRSRGKVTSANASVGAEPLTYSEAHPENSYYRDMFAASSPSSSGYTQARERLQRHQEEVSALASTNSQNKTVRSQSIAVRNYAREEKRATSTGSGSMGDFAPPLYFLEDYAAYRTYGRTLIDVLKHMPMPETGMTFNLPKITTPTQGVNQGGDNTSITSRDMVAAYNTGTLQTVADNLIVSQQYLDRVGPGIQGDRIIHDDQSRQLNRALNLYGWSQFYANAGSAAFSSTASFNSNVSEFRRQLFGLKAVIRRTDGVVAYPTHLVLDGAVWEQIAASYDSTGRPFTVPSGEAFNPIATGQATNVPEGFTGYKLADLPVFVDEAAWVQQEASFFGGSSSSYNHVAAVLAADLFGYWLEGAPVVRVLPQPYANQLSVLVQSFSYCAFVPEYPGTAQGLTGTALADATVTSW